MTALPTVIETFHPYVPGSIDLDDEFEEIPEEEEDYRRYQIVDGQKVYMTCHLRMIYESGVTQAEGTYIRGLREGIWRYFNKNGVLSSVGSYNERNERWRKWRFYEELDGKACLCMIVDIRGNREEYWRFDMDGRAWLNFILLNAMAPHAEQATITKYFSPTDRCWPESDF